MTIFFIMKLRYVEKSIKITTKKLIFVNQRMRNLEKCPKFLDLYVSTYCIISGFADCNQSNPSVTRTASKR